MISPAVIAISLCGGSLGKKQTSPDQNHIKNQHQQQTTKNCYKKRR
jgi:hypothetical protein